MASFQLSAKAKFDLKKIAAFTEKRWGRIQRNAYLYQLDQCFHQLADHPEIGTACDHVKTGYQQFPQGSHQVFYRTNSKGMVEIIRILHKHMVPALRFTRE